MAQYASSTVGTASPSHVSDELNTADMYLNLQIFVPELQLQKCLTVSLDELVWDIKRKLFAALPQALPQSFNFGLFLPPCDGRAGKFLLEDRPIRDYPFHDCVPYVELKYKKRVYKMLKLDEKSLKQLHSKSNLKKFMDYVVNRNSDKVDKWCAQGLDPNFHDSMGETPLTLAAGIAKNRDVIMSLIAGGAHIDFRNSEGQTAMHKAAFLSMTENVKTLLELGASPNYKDPIGLSPLYYCNLTTDSQEGVAQMLLAEAAEIGTMDMHGNHEIHQACKNGLLKHVENLLYYGAEINAQNINGNTPLHVCSVNNRPDCARVLLFRGADPFIMNKQGQTALHVAHIVGNTQVAEMIQSHNPSNSVPYRGTPKYSTRRRMGSQIIRRRSLSQSSLCSAQFDRCYQTPQGVHQSAMPSPSPSRASINNSSEYGTLRRIPPEAVQNQLAGFEPNIPRILVIPRGQKGFGFILRGTKHVEDITFQPTAETPALQFFEGVEMTGMAMKAGLRPGDFLLEINGVDVRCSNHEQVVHLIHQSQDTITLKVITIDQQNGYASQPHYATTSGTLPIRRNNSVPRNGGLPPMPPQRNPNTALTSHTYGHHSGNHTMGYSPDSSDNNSLNYIYQASGDFRNMPGTKSSDTLSIQSIDSINYSDQNRCASVKSRPTARRISAAELEHLMIRQGTSQFQPIHYEQDPYNQNGPKKFTSIANMKRQKQRNGVPSPSMNRLPRTTSGDENGQQPIYEAQHQPLKSFSSSPDLQSAFQPHLRKQSTESTSDYSKPYRSILRPKTPPPAIPTSEVHTSNSMQSTTSTVTAVNNKVDKVPGPPPPPPLPGNFLSSSPQKSSLPSTSSVQPVQSTPSDSSKSDCRGISAEALCNVRLKPVNNTGNGSVPNAPKQIPTSATNEVPNSTPKTPNTKPPLDFDSDLRSALAKRRSKVCSEDDTSEATAVKPQISLNNGTPASRYGGLSLRESVRENVSNVSAPPKLPTKQHSPPGFATKKDSGYTSSRTSLEEQSILTPLAVTPNTSPNTTTIRITENPSVTLISQHLEDSFITQQSVGQPCKPQYTDTVSITSSLSSSDNPNFQSNQIGTRRYLTTSDPSSPPIDYENSDSGTGDSDHDSCATVAPSAISNDSGLPNPSFGNDFYKQKSLIEWDCVDVYDWLHGLELSEYANSFFSNNITGVDLKSLNRASFIQLNVTRVAHRKAIEESIRNYTADKNA